MAESSSSFNIQQDDVLCSRKHQYVVEELLGRGGYGQVVKARKVSCDAPVAIKVVRRDQYASGKNEAKILKVIRKYTGDKSTIVRFLDHFDHENQFCLAFEILDMSLFDFIKMKHFFPLEVNEIRVIAQQMLVALNSLKRIRVMHRDMKCDNIMLVDHMLLPLRVKLIDFGLSVRTYNMMGLKFKQPLSYRPPEVILNFSQDEAIDMWGLGCVLSFLFLGRHLFPARCEYETLSWMVKLLGQPDDTLLSHGFNTDTFFKYVWVEFAYKWRLKTVEEYCKDADDWIPPHTGACSLNLNSLDDMQNMRPQAKDPLEKADLLCFINLLKQMLDMNPSKRITPTKALNHDFITMKHLPGGTNNPYVTASRRKMEMCPQPEAEVEHTPSGSSQSADESLNSDKNKIDYFVQASYSDGQEDSAKTPAGKAKVRTATTPNLPAPVLSKELKHTPLTKSPGASRNTVAVKPGCRSEDRSTPTAGPSASTSRTTTVPSAAVGKKESSRAVKPKASTAPKSPCVGGFCGTESSSSVSSSPINYFSGPSGNKNTCDGSDGSTVRTSSLSTKFCNQKRAESESSTYATRDSTANAEGCPKDMPQRDVELVSVKEAPASNSSVPTDAHDPTPASIPETSASIPETPASISETPASIPETSASIPETPASIPETPASIPETSASIPETPASISETPASIPETPASIPKTSASIPETPASIPETPNGKDNDSKQRKKTVKFLPVITIIPENTPTSPGKVNRVAYCPDNKDRKTKNNCKVVFYPIITVIHKGPSSAGGRVQRAAPPTQIQKPEISSGLVTPSARGTENPSHFVEVKTKNTYFKRMQNFFKRVFTLV